jgi:hypothetical protein
MSDFAVPRRPIKQKTPSHHTVTGLGEYLSLLYMGRSARYFQVNMLKLLYSSLRQCQGLIVNQELSSLMRMRRSAKSPGHCAGLLAQIERRIGSVITSCSSCRGYGSGRYNFLFLPPVIGRADVPSSVMCLRLPFRHEHGGKFSIAHRAGRDHFKSL